MRTPRELVRDRRNRRAFEQAKTTADAAGLRVHGAYKASGEPVYFTTPAGASDRDIAQAAFEAVYGRSITQAEVMLGSAAEGLRKRVPA